MDTRPLVLVADDEPQITKLVAMTLTEEGFRVITARDGEEALDRVASQRPDVVLLDIVMPGLDGIETMRQLREWHPVPVILLTARSSKADVATGLDLGADDYIASRCIRASWPPGCAPCCAGRRGYRPASRWSRSASSRST